MKDWKTVTGTQQERPEEVDRESSPTTVYLRKNIRQVEQKEAEDSGETVSVWQYEEQELESMILMRQAVSENASGIVESVTQFQRDVVIDEYTEQLIEEGLI